MDPFDLDPDLINKVKQFEGYEAIPKWDYKQHSSGWGTRAQPGERPSREEHEQRLRNELGKAAEFVDANVPNLPEGVRNAMISLTFNAGGSWANSGLGSQLRAGDYEGAKQSFLRYNKAGGQTLSGLADRRAAEAAMFQPGTYDTEDRTAVGLGGSRAYGEATTIPDPGQKRMANGDSSGILPLLGMQNQQPQGLLGALGDPETMAYIGMMLKGMNPYSNIDPNAMLSSAHTNALRKEALRQQMAERATDNQRADQALRLNESKFEESKITDAVRAAKDQGLEPGTKEYQDYITSYYAKKTAVQHSLTPIRGEGGKLGTLDAAGNFKVIDTGDFKPEGPTTTRDLGTTIGVFDRGGNLISQTPKDIAGAAEQKVMGTKTGEAKVGLPQALQTADQTIKEIDEIVSHPGRETGTGLSSKLDPRNYIPGTDAYNFAVRVKQVGGRAFLQAYETLKGTGQVTEIEGAKATDAIARMDKAQSDAEFLTAMNDFKGVVNDIKTNLRKKAGMPEEAPQRRQWECTEAAQIRSADGQDG